MLSQVLAKCSFGGSGWSFQPLAVIRAFRGTQPLLVKIPFNWTEAVAERIISVFWDFPPKLELQRDGNAILHLPCDNRSSPSGWPDVHRTELFTFQEPYRVHGNVKLSNILIGEAGDHFLAYLDSSVEIGAELVTKTLNSSQRGTVGH